MSDGKSNIWAQVVAGVFSLLAIYLGYALREKSVESKEYEDLASKRENINDRLKRDNDELQAEIDSLRNALRFRPSEDQPSGGSYQSERSQARIPPITVGDFKLEPIGVLEGDLSTNIVTLTFDLTNLQEDSGVYLYTRSSQVVGDDKISYNAEAARLANSKIARPESNTWAKMYKDQALRGYISYKVAANLQSLKIIEIAINHDAIILRGNYLIHWK